MSSAVIAPKKRVKKKTGPTVSTRILKAVAASSEPGGLSLAALKKVLQAGGYDVVKNKTRILVAIKRLVTKKSLVRTKGSLKLSKKPPRPRKRRVVKKKKPKAKRARKRTSVKKAAKKSPKKKRKAKSPKKAAKKPKRSKKTKAKVSRTRTRAAKK